MTGTHLSSRVQPRLLCLTPHLRIHTPHLLCRESRPPIDASRISHCLSLSSMQEAGAICTDTYVGQLFWRGILRPQRRSLAMSLGGCSSRIGSWLTELSIW